MAASSNRLWALLSLVHVLWNARIISSPSLRHDRNISTHRARDETPPSDLARHLRYRQQQYAHLRVLLGPLADLEQMSAGQGPYISERSGLVGLDTNLESPQEDEQMCECVQTIAARVDTISAGFGQLWAEGQEILRSPGQVFQVKFAKFWQSVAEFRDWIHFTYTEEARLLRKILILANADIARSESEDTTIQNKAELADRQKARVKKVEVVVEVVRVFEEQMIKPA